MPTTQLLPNHLVVVCGHGIWRGGPAKGYDESEWLIESYKAGETPTFIEHIKAGIQVLAEDDRAVVAFSGGPTRKLTPLSEGRSYANLAAANDYFGLLPPVTEDDDAAIAASLHPLSPIPLRPRIIVEERALDSYYNILFSLVAFWRHVNSLKAQSPAAPASASASASSWPLRLTIVSHGFKRSRLVDGHCGPDAIAFLPLDKRVTFIGIDPPNLPAEFGGPADPSDAQAADGSKKEVMMQGAAQVIDDWAKDPHGVGDVLAGKRRGRNQWDSSQKLFVDDEERRLSGLKTRLIGPRKDTEALEEDSPRPWNEVAPA